MTDPNYVLVARAKIARLYANGRTPTQSEEDDARAGYATARIDAFTRRTLADAKGARLDDNDVAHLTGLLLAHAGVKAEAVGFLETLVRAAVLEAQQGGES